jgi:hypothetical protein
MQNKEHSSVVVFINKKNVSESNIANLYKNTVTWLDVKKEKPYLYLKLVISSPIIDLTDPLRKLNIQNKIIKDFPGLKSVICKTIKFDMNKKNLMIDSNGKYFTIVNA